MSPFPFSGISAQHFTKSTGLKAPTEAYGFVFN